MPPPASPPSALVTELMEHVGAWRHVSLAPHAAHAVAVRMKDVTIGVLHHDGLLEVPMPPPLCTALVDDGLAAPHPTRPETDWVSLFLNDLTDVAPATLLLRLSYLYRRLLRSQTPGGLRRIRIELEQYDLPASLLRLYEAMLAKRTAAGSASGAPFPSGPSSH